MELRMKGWGEKDLVPRRVEERMESQKAQDTSNVTSASICAHRRMIDDILTRGGKRTGKVRCLECGAKFDDPYHGLR